MAEYEPETNNKPFHVRLLGKDRMALFSFIQSINTSLGISIFEQVAEIIARSHFKQAINQYKGLNNRISSSAQNVIQNIMDDLRTTRKLPNKVAETEEILKIAQSGIHRTIKRPRIDLFVESNDGVEYYIDLKTAKPNIEGFVELKRKMLEWVAIRGVENPQAKIKTILAIPYNPYEPKPYQRWTLQGLFEVQNEIFIAEEFWDFLGGKDTYKDVLDIFEYVGIALRPEIDSKFSTFASK